MNTPRALSPNRLVVAALLGLACTVGLAQTSGIDRSLNDRSVRIQDDFYRHVNGGWVDKTPIPEHRASIGAFEQIHENTQPQLRGLIEAAMRRPADAHARKIGDLYASFMDEARLEALGAKPLAAELAAIDAVKTAGELSALFARHTALGVPSPLGFWIHQDAKDSSRIVADLAQGGLGLPDRDYYLNTDDARLATVREQYVVMLARLYGLAGIGETQARSDAKAVLALETEIARVSRSRVDNRDPVKLYNPYELGALHALAPQIGWQLWLEAGGLAGKIDSLIVSQPEFVTGIGKLFETTPVETWRAYARGRLLFTYAPYLSRDFVDARFAFVGPVLRGTPELPPRWKRGVQQVELSMGEALGRLYVAKYFPPASKVRMEKLVANLLEAYRQGIARLDWMSPETKKEAQAKLATFTPKIGYPKRWIDYSSLEIRRDDLAGNVMRASLFDHARQIAKLGKPVDRDEWLMTPQTVNAYYNPELNEIVFPAAILQPPFFDPKADDAANYGGIGSVIGHEISHGFDDEGSQYDGQGHLRNWWTAEDRARFEAKADKLVKQYDAFEPVPGYRVNGRLTLGENIADVSGLAIAYQAWQLSLNGRPAKKIGGLSGAERFFYGYAQIWRGKRREQALIELLKSNPHSPDEYRANGAVRNEQGFYDTFGVKPGDRLYLAPEERVKIW
ncbi:M13 family metallopeptidase [Caldimonas sp. KR1-144]|uniref:M13 family metallopeptidase n=1 Tax=Caldimonas sp. KR1-144 TaxID=3400911 RepID=UPI003BFF3E52